MARRTTDEFGEPGSLDEERIRADERAKIERDLSALGAEQRDRSSDVRDEMGPVHTDRPVEEPQDPDMIRERHEPDTAYERDTPDMIRERHEPDTVYERDTIYERDEIRDREVEVVRKRAFSFGQLISLLVGAALVVLGVFALIATGLETPLDQPVEQVMGYDHTPLLGILEVVAGGLLVLFSLRPGGRWLVAAVGAALVVGGVLIATDFDWTAEELAAEPEYAWIPIVAGGVALLAAILTPRRYQRMSGVPVDERA